MEKLNKPDGAKKSLTDKRKLSILDSHIQRYLDLSQQYGKEPEKYCTKPQYDEEGKLGIFDIKTKLYPIIVAQTMELIKSTDLESALKQLEKAAKIFALEKDFQRVRDAAGQASRMCHEWSELVWGKIYAAMLNPGLVAFLEESDSHNFSMGFWCVILTVPRAQSMLPSVGLTYNFVGQLEEMTEDDSMYWWVPGVGDPQFNDRGYKYEHERCDFAADGAIMLAAMNSNPAKIFVGAAGALLELADPGYLNVFKNGDVPLQQIDAYDSDRALDAEELIFNRAPKLREIVNYHYADLSKILEEKVAEGPQYDYAYIMGLICYVPHLAPKIIGAMMAILKPGGSFRYDMEYDDIIWKRNASLFNWGGVTAQMQINLYPRDKMIEKIKSDIALVAQAPFLAGKDFSFENNVKIVEDSQKMGCFIEITKPV